MNRKERHGSLKMNQRDLIVCVLFYPRGLCGDGHDQAHELQQRQPNTGCNRDGNSCPGSVI
ncbi:MAG: hypothetical protein AUK55_11005 [Syntrophobacteraceae bacterium CG2_30_61_12]|nr:MAG: hypothetical protein AUK55_11005 [Syntrophobacteraceae bacterium CG2_30_61_12]PIU32271.1 MAG: hypothetical protein COT06_03625 [Syntrophobacteraceae bacterium CG07_land_8_20_14_0_80_61_8]